VKVAKNFSRKRRKKQPERHKLFILIYAVL